MLKLEIVGTYSFSRIVFHAVINMPLYQAEHHEVLEEQSDSI